MAPIISDSPINLPDVLGRTWVLANQVNFKGVSQILSSLSPGMRNLVPGLQGRAVRSSSENAEVDSGTGSCVLAHLEISGVTHLPESCVIYS